MGPQAQISALPDICALRVILLVYECYAVIFPLIEGVGSANTTISGRQCQRWDSQSPHIHPYSYLSAFENFCMNPNEDEALWCYTTDVHQITEFCPPSFYHGKFLFLILHRGQVKTLQSILVCNCG